MRRRLVGFSRFEDVDEALKKLINLVNIKLDVIEVPVKESLGMVCAEDVKAPYDIPPYDRSAVDGYAVRSINTLSASPHNPIYFKVVYTVEAGDDVTSLTPLREDEAALIFTGAPLPPGADAVVPVEDAVREGDAVRIMRAVAPYANVSRRGEDFKAGELVVRRGTYIMPWHIAALASSNIVNVKVFRRVRVAIVSTGNELREVGSELKPYEIVNSTALLIESYVKLLGAEPTYLGIVPDEIEAIRGAVVKGLKLADVVIVTGGTSVGGKDLTPEAIEGIEGAVKAFHGVAMRPGRTAGAYVVRGKPVFLLSGLPVACLISMEVFLEPLVRYLTNSEPRPRPKVTGVLMRRLANEVGLRSYYRVRVCLGNDGRYYVEPLRLTGSGILSTLIKGNGILEIPGNIEGFDEGELVEVTLVNPVGKCSNDQ